MTGNFVFTMNPQINDKTSNKGSLSSVLSKVDNAYFRFNTGCVLRTVDLQSNIMSSCCPSPGRVIWFTFSRTSRSPTTKSPTLTICVLRHLETATRTSSTLVQHTVSMCGSSVVFVDDLCMLQSRQKQVTFFNPANDL